MYKGTVKLFRCWNTSLGANSTNHLITVIKYGQSSHTDLHSQWYYINSTSKSWNHLQWALLFRSMKIPRKVILNLLHINWPLTISVWCQKWRFAYKMWLLINGFCRGRLRPLVENILSFQLTEKIAQANWNT